MSYSEKSRDAAPGAALIELDGVTKSFSRGGESIRVLDGLSLSIRNGEFAALMGPSGSGKTTLLNIIAGLDAPDAGKALVAGTDLAKLSQAALARWRADNVGFVFQFYNLLPVLTALENVALPLSLLRMSSRERKDRASFALEVVGLADRAKHLPAQLSGGQEQRVAIARAIVSDPKLIVADEPTGDLDRSSADEILGLLGRLNREYSKTIVMVTHDAAAADRAGRVVRLDKGKLMASDA